MRGYAEVSYGGEVAGEAGARRLWAKVSAKRKRLGNELEMRKSGKIRSEIAK